MLELLDPNRGLVLGSDKAVCHITLDDNRMRRVSSKHIRIFLDPEDETANDKIIMECISRVNGFRVVSTSKKLDESINPRQKLKLSGGLWSVKLLAKIDVDFLIYFPDHGPAQNEYDTNCRALRGDEKIGKAGSYTAIASVNPTPQITEPLFKIDWERKILGEGTFGQVRYASDWSGTTIYAAKIFKRKGKAQIERRFLEGIRHTHIVKYQAFLEDNENDVLIMELLEGGTLQNLLNEKQHLRPRQIRILHQDIKPEKILFDARGIIKLCDFGFAKQLMEDELYTYSQVGSPRYAAPEIVKRRGYDEVCDMWSFGIVVLEMHSILPGATGPWRINGGVESPQWQAFIAAVNEQVNGLDNSYFLLKSQLSPEPRGRPKPATLMVELWERYSDDIKLAREIAQRD